MASAYCPEQIERYLDYIDFPPHLRAPDTPRDSAFLTRLHVHQISKIPYDNLSLHYSETHQNSLDPQLLYDKFTRNGRGGYCMETAVFFRHVLMALGFRVYTAGARIRYRRDGIPQGPYIGWVHCVNIVTFENGEKWSVDVGFGGDGATKPLRLESGVAVQNLGSQEVRLVYDSLPDASEPHQQKVWIYQYRNSSDRDWNSFYAFAEFEFFQADLEQMNFWTSNFPTSFQRFQVLIVKFLRTGEQIVGKVMLADDKVKRNTGSRTEIVKICGNEDERVRALKDYFDIDLTEEEVQGIRGWLTELKASQ